MVEFSIITPCGYRDKKRILGLQKMLNKQTYKNFEWIVSSNERYFGLPTTHIKQYIINSENTVGDARNKALQIADGQYILFVDADDYLKPDALMMAHNLIAQHPNSTNIFDLNPYYTYEPLSSFLNSVHNLRDLEYKLPQWGDNKSSYITLNEQAPKRTKYNHKVYSKQEWDYYGLDKYSNLDEKLLCEGKIIPKTLIVQYHLHFLKTNLFTSRPFMLQAIYYTHMIIRSNKHEYIMVHHNNPITDPSIYELKANNYWSSLLRNDYISIKLLMAIEAKNNSKSLQEFAQYTLDQIRTYLYKAITLNDITLYNRQIIVFDQLRTYLRTIDSITNLHYNHKIAKNIILGNYPTAKQQMKLICSLRIIHNLIKQHGKSLPKTLYFTHYLNLPLKINTILFESFLGRSFSDNPKYIYLYLQKKYSNKYKYVWVADSKHFMHIKKLLAHEPNTIVVKRWSFKYMKYLATAQYFIFNMRQPKWFVKRHGMKFLETWHGTPLKRLVFDLKDVTAATKLYKETFYHQSRQWDNLIAPNKFSYYIFNHAFKYPTNKMILANYPRNIILNTHNKQSYVKKIKKQLHIPLNKKVILYAPTWRDNHYYAPGQYEFKLHLNLNLLRKKLGNKYVVLLRTHYFIANHVNTSKYGNFVYNVSNYDDISKLYLISDILITDYSSVFFDYAQLKRPILYFAYDYNSYAKVLHGFYLDMQKDLPGPILTTSKQIVNAIQNINTIKLKYKDRYNKFNQRFNKKLSTKQSIQKIINIFLFNKDK